MPEILNDSALFFNPWSSNEMSEQIYAVLSNETLKQELRNKGLENVKRFSWKKCAEQTLAVYQSI